jgi:flagellar biosynthesis protein FliR
MELCNGEMTIHKTLRAIAKSFAILPFNIYLPQHMSFNVIKKSVSRLFLTTTALSSAKHLQ